MPLEYKRRAGSTRRTLTKEVLANAIEEVASGSAINRIAKKYGIERTTLRRYCRDRRKLEAFDHKGRFGSAQIFTIAEEKILLGYIQTYDEMNDGVTQEQARQLAFQFGSANDIKIPDAWVKNRSAGRDWFKGFLGRNPDVIVQSSEGTSSKENRNVGDFFESLRSIHEKYSTALRDAQAKVRELTKKTEDLEQQKMEYQRKITVLERMNEELVQSNYEYSKKLALIMSKDKVVRPPKKTIFLEEPMPKTSSTAGGEAPEKKPRGSTKSGKSQGVTTKGAKKRPHPESSPPEQHIAPIEASADTHKATDYALNLDLLPVKTEPDPLEDPPVVSTTYINPLGGSTTYIDPLKDPGTHGTTLANLLSEPSTKFIESLGDTGAFVSPLAAIASTLESGSERFTLYGEANNGLISVENIKIEEDITIVEHNLEEEERYTVVVTEH